MKVSAWAGGGHLVLKRERERERERVGISETLAMQPNYT
jgi:hypothetical protein